MSVEHESGDGCATYQPGYELTAIGYPDPVDAEDVEVGDYVRDPARDAKGVWFQVDDTWSDDENDEIHLFLVPATAAEVADARRDACEGHESTAGGIGDTQYCDGSCVSSAKGSAC